MSQRDATHATHAVHHEHGFVRTYIFSTDHKMIGRQYLFYGLIMMILGGLLALLLRWQLAWPETAVIGFGWIPEPFMYQGIIPADTYNTLFTMHATIMIFFVVMPILVGAYVPKMNPLIVLGACAGAGTITAALRAVQEEADSKLPALGYTVPYAVGNILLTAWGPVIVALMR